MRRQVASVVFAASVSIARTAVAHVPPDLAAGRLQVGRKVAITDEQGARITGRVTGLAADRVTIGDDAAGREVPFPGIVRIEERPRGRRASRPTGPG